MNAWNPAASQLPPRRRQKYGNAITEYRGRKYHSRKEARRAAQLDLLEAAGRVRNIRRQVKYQLKIGEQVICSYIADFCYESYDHGSWTPVVEDVKGVRTREYLLKKRLVKALLDIDIVET